MSLTRAAGYPDYGPRNTGASRYIPEIWAGKLIEKFYKATVFADISNTDYQGEIKSQGDTVILRQIGNVTINDYAIGQKLNYERLESTSIELKIDKGKYFAFTCDDVTAYQADIKIMNEWSKDAAEQMKITIDAQLLKELTYGPTATAGTFPGHASNTGATAGVISSSFNLGTLGVAGAGTSIQITKTNVLEYIIDCGTVLDEQNIPESNRWMVIPSWMANMIKKSDLKDASLTGEASTLSNGRIGKIDRFTLYLSNNLYSQSDGTFTAYCIPFGINLGMAFAAQITKMETLRAESTFGDLVRGLNVYGHKVIKPEAIGLIYAHK